MTKSNIIFIVGGARSGKSRFAARLAKEAGKRVLFIATCVPQDDEMRRRVALHKRSRPKTWKVIEEGKNITPALKKLKGKFDAVIIDCLGLLISNLLEEGLSQKNILSRIKSITQSLSKLKTTSIVVSNEVGGGIVPDNPLARNFRDIVGLANQSMAADADIVYTMQAGIPVKIKGRT